VTSSYFEGQHNALAEHGYNRDGKRYKKQIVHGLLTDQSGEPISVQVYRGNTTDTNTVADQVRKIRERFGMQDVVFVGDRGMVRGKGKQAVVDAGMRYLTALTDPQVRKLLGNGVIQMGLFDERACEVVSGDKRYVMRRNPLSQQRDRARRDDQLKRVTDKVQQRNAHSLERPRCKPQTSLQQAEHWLKRYRLDGFVSARLDGRQVHLDIDEARRAKAELLDGCYVLETNLPAGQMDAAALDTRYRSLAVVERDFRMEKTGLLQVRPIFLRKESRTRGHALATMLALKIAREFDRRVASAQITVQDALERLTGVRLVTLADPKLNLWILPAHYEEPQAEVLNCLPHLPAPRLSLKPARQGKGNTRLRRANT
jgi:transposase